MFLAAARVGPTGKAIGIDMTPEMLELARRNAANGEGGQPIANVEFHQATIDKLPLPDASVDCVISNCVITSFPTSGPSSGRSFACSSREAVWRRATSL